MPTYHWNSKSKLFAAIFLLGTLASCEKTPTVPKDKQISDIAIDAYIYGYPLITMDQTRRVMTNVVSPEGAHAPMGQFANSKTYPDATFKDVTAPNADTLYSTAWVNVAEEPYILHVPKEEGRYYLMPMLSAWTNVFASPGTRTTGTDEGNYAIVGPEWKGKLPDGVKELRSPTNMVWILGRTYCSGTPEDFKKVYALQNEYTLTPLSAFGKAYKPEAGRIDPDVDMLSPVRSQVNYMSAETFFKRLAKLLLENPPAKEDASIVDDMAKIGIVAGEPFDISAFDAQMADAILAAPGKAQEKIMGAVKSFGETVNGWTVSLKTGQYSQDYLLRAYIAAIGLGANLPQDAVYPTTTVDNEGKPLSGDHQYVIHFNDGQMPPVKGFWSLTMYDEDYFFVANPLNRFTLSQRDKLKYNIDGSVDLYIQHESPGKDKESNWLPAPDGKFVLMMRLYWPNETPPSILDGTWKPPAVQRVK